MIDTFIDDDDGRVGISIDFTVPLWLIRLFRPYHTGDDDDIHLSVYEEAMKTMMERATMQILSRSLELNYVKWKSGLSYTMTKYPAPPTDQE